MLLDGYHDVPAGKLAAVVTHLEMSSRPEPRAMSDVAVTLAEHAMPNPEWYRDLFRRVGGLDWLWFSRLGFSDAELTSIIHDPLVRVFSVQQNDKDVGLLELDFRQPDECELAYFGLAASLVGQGVGRWLMEHALDRAFAEPIRRFHLHTCTLDSPQALDFYVRSGFTPYRRQIEIADDPRLSGALPKDAASQVPIL